MTTGKTSSGRTGGKKPQKIIDLEAQEVKPEVAANADKEATSAKSEPSGKPAAGTDAKVETQSHTKSQPASGTSRETVSVETGTKEKRSEGATKPSNESQVKAGRQQAATSGAPAGSSTEKSFAARYLPLFAAAFLGGIVALGGYNVLKRSETNAPAASVAGAVADLTNQVEANKSQITGEIATLRGESESRVSAIDDKVGELTAAFDSMKAEIAGQANAAPVNNTGDYAASGEVKELSARLDAVESALAKVQQATSASGGANPEQIDELRTEVERLSAEFSGVKDRFSEISGKVEAYEDNAADIAKAANEVRAIRDREVDAAQKRMREAMAGALQNAHDQAGDIVSLLEPTRSLLGPSEAIDNLQALAQSGIATNDELIKGLNQLTGNMLAATADEPEGVVGKLLSNARTLVTIKPAGPVDGGDPAAIISRIEADLAAVDLAGAMAEWETLPVQSKTESAVWQKKLADRLKADQLVDKIVADLRAGSGDQG
jgi:hypothetical protein